MSLISGRNMVRRLSRVWLNRLALPFLCLSLAVACATPKALAPNEEQARLLDSIPLFTDGGSANWIQDLENPIQGVTADLREGTHSNSKRLHLRWWEGSSFTKTIEFRHPEGIPFDCEGTEQIGSLSFHIRKVGPSQSDPTLIIKLCDFDGNCSSTHLAPHHLEKTYIDTAWQEVRVPFSDLQRGRSATLWSEAISFQFGLEGFGEIEIENIVLVPMEPRRKSWKRRKNPNLLPVRPGFHYVFKDEIHHGWGLGERRGLRTFDVKPFRGVNESEAIILQWNYLNKPLSRDNTDPRDNGFGLSWNAWLPYARPEKANQAQLVFMLRNLDVKRGPSANIPLNVGLTDHLHHSEFVNVSRFLDGAQGQWQKCSVPLGEFQWKTDTSDGLQSIEQIAFSVDSAGHIFLDNIRLEY